MLVRADAIPVVEMIKAAEAVDAEAAALWLHMGLWDSLGEMIDESRPEIDRVWKAVVSKRSDSARRLLVRQAVERRVEGDEIDDVVKAAAGLSLVRGYVAKDGEHRTEDEYNQTPQGHVHPKGQHGWFVSLGEQTRSGGQATRVEGSAYDAMAGLTQRNTGLESRAKDVATQLNDKDNVPYAQMRVVGNALVATGHPKAMAAGGVVRVAAEVGPSAEDVLGTHLRRAAYRYRGTEKRPDRGLQQQTKEASAYVAGLTGPARSLAEQQYQANLRRQLDDRKPGEWAKGAVAYRAAQPHESEDQLEMRVTGDVAAAYLIRQLPSKDEALLSQEAGRTPPSVGVLIDADGDVVSEAMGFQGDHYVPFDLRNLKRLKGGSYVRTRALGGPTSEDIYTGLLTGARQMQVVSRSGVFTVEFDPDLRGGRRYSDKARQMVDRYSRLLDVVERGTSQPRKPGEEPEPIYTNDIPPARRRELFADAMKAADYDRDRAKIIYNRRLKQERAKAEIEAGFSEEDLDGAVETQLQEWIRNKRGAKQAPSQAEIGRAREDIRRDVLDQMREAKDQGVPQQLKLNAEGYFRAMQSLRREFPYYIRDVSYESLPEFEERRSTRAYGEAPIDFGAPGAAARRTHVQRGELLPAEQLRAYGRKGGANADADEGGKGGESKEKKTEGGGKKLDAPLKNEAVRDEIARQANVMRVALETGPAGPVVELPQPAQGRSMDEQYALTLSPKEYVGWLVNSANTVTGGSSQKVAQFLLEKASPADLKRVSDGLRQIGDTREYGGDYAPERMAQFQRTLATISAAREPYGESADKVLYAPSEDNPKPLAFPEVLDNTGDREDFDKVKADWIAHGNMDEAFEWAQQTDDQEAARQLRRLVRNFESVKEWADEVKNAKPGKLVPKPDDLVNLKVGGRAYSIDQSEAQEWARDPKSSPLYLEIERKQRAWAWVYTDRLMRDLKAVAGGEADPKQSRPERPALESGETTQLGKRQPRRRVVYLEAEDPFAKAFQRRLRASERATRR